MPSLRSQLARAASATDANFHRSSTWNPASRHAPATRPLAAATVAASKAPCSKRGLPPSTGRVVRHRSRARAAPPEAREALAMSAATSAR